MKFKECPLQGAWIVDLEPAHDARGSFSRAFCQKEFEAHGIESAFVQSNLSYSKVAGTMRGLHLQRSPMGESKLIRCVRGAIYDVMIDMRPESATYLQHFGVKLSAENKRMLYMPQDFAHGFMTLEDNTEAFYMVGEYYSPEYESGMRYDDPFFDIKWPISVTSISDKDLSWPFFERPGVH